MSAHHAMHFLEGIDGKPSFLAPNMSLLHPTVGGMNPGSIRSHIAMLVDATPEQLMQGTERTNEELADVFGGQFDVSSKPYPMVEGNAIIPIHGTLLNRFNYSIGYATGYSFIKAQLDAAEADPDVTGIIFDINSYGGLVAGCGETAKRILDCTKPTLALIDAACCSAAYYLASGADKINAIPSATTGSIGVLIMHVDYSQALDKAGIKITFIKGGEHKVDGNSYEPLSDDVKATLQASIDKSYDAFTSAVALGRGLDQSAVVDTQARIYQSDEALSIGLIDSVTSTADAVSQFIEGDDSDETNLSRRNEVTGSAKQENTITQAQVDQAAADARKAERERVSGIMGHAEAKGRETLANHLAMNTDMTVEAAGAVLAASAKKEEAKPVATEQKQEPNHFKTAMDNMGGAGAGSENGGEGGGEQMSKAQRILASQRKAGGSRSVPAK